MTKNSSMIIGGGFVVGSLFMFSLHFLVVGPIIDREIQAGRAMHAAQK